MSERKGKSNVRRSLVETRILDEAAALFAERGFAETSLQDVADALGIGRTALYHYIGSKDELLETLVKGLTQVTAESLEQIASEPTLDPLNRLRTAAHTMAARIADSPGKFRLLLVSEGALAEPTASEHARARVRSLNALTRIVEEGVDGGDLRPVDPHLAAFALLGMVNWIAWWYRPERIAGQTPASVADAFADLAVEMLRSDRGIQAGARAVPDLLRILREDIDLLENAIQASSGRTA
ncbi:MAG TPA: TetR/AcrR family transcriptional regulator [Gaiellaceae bacterium]|nr:TetR/AcrR family transcriptional regulator [Gaiellaceae bacterium]